eukprot:3159011-Pyramimonas_sp.AAC.1
MGLPSDMTRAPVDTKEVDQCFAGRGTQKGLRKRQKSYPGVDELHFEVLLQQPLHTPSGKTAADDRHTFAASFPHYKPI